MGALTHVRTLLASAEGYPCRCGGSRPALEYHTSRGCTNDPLALAGAYDVDDPLSPAEIRTRDELPLEGSSSPPILVVLWKALLE